MRRNGTCQVMASLEVSLMPEENEPMLKNESQVPSIESTVGQSSRGGESDNRHPLSRSPGRSVFGFTNPSNYTNVKSSVTTAKGSSSALVNTDDQTTRSSLLRDKSLNSGQQSTIHQRSPVNTLDASVTNIPGHLCRVCIPLRSIAASPSSPSVPNQVACYLCHSPNPGHLSLDRESASLTRPEGQVFSTMTGVPGSPGTSLIPKSSNMPLDMNIYATRKTIAQGMLDICLMISNATQLKYILLHAPRHKYVEATIALITLSILLQIIIGIILIFQGRWNINYRGDQRKADIANNIVVILIFLVTVVNVMASAFGPSELPLSSHLTGSASTTATISFLPPSTVSNSP